MEQQEYTAKELKQIFKDKLANAEDSYQHYTMVDKDPFLASYAKEDILVAKSVLRLIESLEKPTTNDRDYWEENLKDDIKNGTQTALTFKFDDEHSYTIEVEDIEQLKPSELYEKRMLDCLVNYANCFKNIENEREKINNEK